MVTLLLTTTLAIGVAIALGSTVHPAKALIGCASRGQGLEDMPGHPEKVRAVDDPVAEEAFWDTAQALLDDGMAEVNDRWGWIR